MTLESGFHECSEGNQDSKKSLYPIDNPNKVWVGNLTQQPSINEVTDTFKNVGKTNRVVIFLSMGLTSNSLYGTKCDFSPLKTEISAIGLAGKDFSTPLPTFACSGLINIYCVCFIL